MTNSGFEHSFRDDAWMEAFGQQVSESMHLADMGRRQCETRDMLRDLFLTLRSVDLNRLPDLPIAGASDYFGYAVPWFNTTPRLHAKLEIYKCKADETYDVSYHELEHVRAVGQPADLVVSSESFLVAFPNQLRDPRIQRPFRLRKTQREAQPEKLWTRLHEILTLKD